MRIQRTALLCLSAGLLLSGCGPDRLSPNGQRPNGLSPNGSTEPADAGAASARRKSPPYVGEIPQGAQSVAEEAQSGSGGTSTSTTVTGPISLANALDSINRRIDDEGLSVRRLSPEDVGTWFEDGKSFQWSKAERKTLEQAFSVGQISDGWTLTLEKVSADIPWRVTLRSPAQEVLLPGGMIVEIVAGGTIVEGTDLTPYTQYHRAVCQRDPSHNLCEESFAGATPSLESVGLPASVEVRVQPIEVAGEPQVPEMAERDALEVSVNLTAASIPALVDYFAVGYDRAALQDRLVTLLGAKSSNWVSVQEFFVGWIRDRANTFPGADDNDVCHGPARQFYNDTLYNGGSDRSTEASALLLKEHYCLVGDDIAPRFGDYLYNPGAHSARFILTDPATHRDVVFSVQSGGFSAYRFWWADEDMSGKPFAHEPMTDYRQKRVDTWRRCR